MFKLIILCLNTRCNLKNWWLLLLLHTRNHRSSARSTPGSFILCRTKCTQTHHHIQLGILYSADPMYVGPIGLGRVKLISKVLNVSAANLGPADPLQSCITSMQPESGKRLHIRPTMRAPSGSQKTLCATSSLIASPES
ncbi:hypothetical protein M758_1G113600 [Ceratodon purpureus]|nr:hypothetical protein M758_1G113600 [Ceratodon purpureus]